MSPHYYSLNEYLQKTFGEKLYKLALNGGMTCPNRDGRLDTRGCCFCSAGGSGEFTPSFTKISEQIETAKALVAGKFKGRHYIGYFQNFTNTYAPITYLEEIFSEALQNPDLAGLSIGTRPDCLAPDVIELLSRLNSHKKIWVELGLQTIHESTARYIRRGYDLAVYDDAVSRLAQAGIETVSHMILGLPGETPEMMAATASHIAHSPVTGIKLQLLHVLKGTDLAADYAQGRFCVLSMQAYFDIVGELLRRLPPQMVIHRITGDGPKNLLIAPLWSSNKHFVLNSLNRYLQENEIYQGSLYSP